VGKPLENKTDINIGAPPFAQLSFVSAAAAVTQKSAGYLAKRWRRVLPGKRIAVARMAPVVAAAFLAAPASQWYTAVV